MMVKTHGGDLMHWLTVVLIVIFSLFGAKIVFYDLPAHLEVTGHPGYFKNVFIVLAVFLVISGIAFLFTGTWLNLDTP